MKIQEDPLCSACGEQEDTSLHFLGECYANMQIRYSIFGAQLMQPSELHKVEPSTLAFRKSHKEVLVTFGCNGDVHWAKRPQHWVEAHPKDKQQVTYSLC